MPSTATQTKTYQSLAPSAEASLAVTIVMPCLNEAETLAVCVQKAIAAIQSTGLSGEVLVADNGSTDGSQEIARREGARVVDVPVRGYGAALQHGINNARGEYVLMADADDSYEFAHLPRFIEALQNGADLVMGNRFQGGIKEGAMPPLHRYLGNPVLSFIGRLFFKAPVGDFHCGMRAFSKRAIESLNLTTTGMEFASEMVVKASLSGLRINEVPTTLSPDGRSRAPHLRTWRDGWRHLRFLLLYSPRWLFLYPGIALMLLGALAATWLIPGEQSIGKFHFDVDTLAYALACVLVGFHACTFAVSAKMFGMSHGLLPPDPFFDRLGQKVSLENGLYAGGLIFLAGVGLTFYALHIWSQASYGSLSPTVILRVTLPAATALMLSVEVIFTSFFLSLLAMRRN